MYITFEVFLANFSFIILFLSMLIYWFQATSSTDLTYNKENNILINKNSIIFEDVSTSKLIANKNLGSLGMLIANLSLFILLLVRWNESGHFPLSNLYESLMFLSWSLTLIHLIIEYIFNSPGGSVFSSQGSPGGSFSETNFNFFQTYTVLPTKQKRKILINKLIGSITAPSALFTNAFASFSLPKEMQEAGPLVPALQSNWLMMHVTVMILSYAALILGSLLSIGFLVISKSLNLTNSSELLVGGPSSAINKSSLAKTLDNLSYRILGLGFPLLTIGILSGAVWANEAWGSYWSWDPKETWALLTWLVFAIYLHTRLTKGWEGEKPALIASLGFITVWICFLGVNLIGEGLHSYGWLS